MNHFASVGNMVDSELSLEVFRIKRDYHRLAYFEEMLPILHGRCAAYEDMLRTIEAEVKEVTQDKNADAHTVKTFVNEANERKTQVYREYQPAIAELRTIQAELPTLRERVAAYAGDNTDNG